jgi:CMP-N,N'-diacetyllegionaminic acid synthase
MIGGNRVLGLIPARGGSKGVPRKNLRLLLGKPLLQWTAEAAHGSRYIDRLVLSTEDEEIAQVGKALGIDVPFRRPADVASDTASAADVIRHAVTAIPEQYDYLVYLEPTTPLRAPADIDGCLQRLVDTGAAFCVTLSEVKTRPEWTFYVNNGGFLEPAGRRSAAILRQDLPPCFILNGGVYAARISAYLRTGTFLTDETLGYVMPVERGIEIDSFADLQAAEAAVLGGSPPHVSGELGDCSD